MTFVPLIQMQCGDYLVSFMDAGDTLMMRTNLETLPLYMSLGLSSHKSEAFLAAMDSWAVCPYELKKDTLFGHVKLMASTGAPKLGPPKILD
jgi:hypothetical protein